MREQAGCKQHEGASSKQGASSVRVQAASSANSMKVEAESRVQAMLGCRQQASIKHGWTFTKVRAS